MPKFDIRFVCSLLKKMATKKNQQLNISPRSIKDYNLIFYLFHGEKKKLLNSYHEKVVIL